MSERYSEIRSFGEALGIFRTRAGISQQELAHRLDRGLRAVGGWERGETLPRTRDLVMQIADILKLDDEDRMLLLKTAGMDPSPVIWNIPFQRNPFFTGREDILQHLQKALSTDKTVILMQPQALRGLGGIGKTQIAVEYAYRHRNEYQAILWTTADSFNALKAGLVAIAELLNLPQKNESDQELIVEAVKKWLGYHTRWLLILDNVEDPTIVKPLYPDAHRGHVIITTRSQATGGSVLGVTIEKMEPEEGALFLLRRAMIIGYNEGSERASAIDYDKAKELSQVLDGLPLALDQAAAYIEETKCGLSSYLSLYQTQRTRLLDERGNLSTDHPEPVTVTFSLAFQKVQNTNPAAGELLQFCAFLAPDAIPEEIITEGGSHLGETLASMASNPFELNAAIRILLAYSFVSRNTDAITQIHLLSVHRLVQSVLKDEMRPETYRQWAERAISCVVQVFSTMKASTWVRYERYLLHALACVELIRSQEIKSAKALKLLESTGYYLCQRGRYSDAEVHLKQVLAIYEQMRERDDSSYVGFTNALSNLAGLYFTQGKYEQAEPPVQRALTISEQTFGPNHLYLAAHLNNLAVIYKAQSKYALSEAAYQRALAIRVKEQGVDSTEVGETETNLAELYYLLGKYEQAESLYEHAIAIFKQALGPDHPGTIPVLNFLILLYIAQGRYEQIEPLAQHALEIREQMLGPEHRETAESLNTLALFYYTQEKYKQAEPLIQRALSIQEQALGPEHPEVAESLNTLALIYREQEKYEQSETLFKRALAIREQHLGTKHPNTAASLNDLARLYRLQGKYTQGEPLLQRALEIREEVLGPEHPETADTLHELASFYLFQGRQIEAKSLYQRALIIRERSFGSHHPKTTDTQTCYAALLRDMNQGEEAAHPEVAQSESTHAEE